MKHYILLFSISILFSCKQKKEKSEEPRISTTEPTLIISNLSKELNKKNDTLFFRNKKMCGTLYSLNTAQTDTLFIENYINGILDGVSKRWYSNAQLMEERIYNLGQKNGKQVAYFENGKMKFEFTAKYDQYEGELKEWNNDGNLIHLATYKNGQEEGTQKMWYDNGKIRANYVMIKGKRYGLLGTKNCKNVSDSIFIVK